MLRKALRTIFWIPEEFGIYLEKIVLYQEFTSLLSRSSFYKQLIFISQMYPYIITPGECKTPHFMSINKYFFISFSVLRIIFLSHNKFRNACPIIWYKSYLPDTISISNRYYLTWQMLLLGSYYVSDTTFSYQNQNLYIFGFEASKILLKEEISS